MNKKLKAGIVIVSVLAFAFILAGGLGVRASSSEGAYKQMGVYSEVLQRIRSEYVEEPNFDAVRNGALKGLLESLDANSSYLSPSEYKHFKEQHPDWKANIGASVSKRFGFVAIVSVVPGSPADKAGLETGDILESIEGKGTREISLAEARNLLMGQKGSNISLSVIHPRKAEPQKIVIQRDEISLPAVQQKVLESNIGYLRPGSFVKGKTQELAAKIKQVQSSGAKKLILDLRNTAEGDMAEGIATANLFLDHGTIASLKGQQYPKEEFAAEPAKTITKLPLLVLVNRGTAGPAEVVAAAILENTRGDVLGDKTFGMGSMQKLFETQDGSALILSIAKYYTPGGKAIQDTAITPNILVPSTPDQADAEEDVDGAEATESPKKDLSPKGDDQLQRAIAALKNKAS